MTAAPDCCERCTTENACRHLGTCLLVDEDRARQAVVDAANEEDQ